jgi:hypothetical protein
MVPLNAGDDKPARPHGKSGKKVTLKNTLNQTLPTQLKDVNGEFYERKLNRRERFTITEAEMTPLLESQIASGIIKRYN